MFDSLILLEDLELRALTLSDKGSVLELCQSCVDYFLLSDGSAPTEESVTNLLSDLPPGKSAKDKFNLGIFKGEELLCLVDLIRDYPNIGEWVLGLLLVAPKARGQGLGRLVHKVVAEWAKALGASRLRIGVLEQNTSAQRFWLRLGYQTTNQAKLEIGGQKQVVNALILPL